MSTEDEILAIERQLWTGGREAYERHVDERCLVAFTGMAGVLGRDAVAASTEGAPRWRDPHLEVQGMLEPVAGLAILSYRARASRGDGEVYEALVSSAYARRPGGWKVVFHQQTPLAS